MKTIYRILCTVAVVFACCACNNEWEDELYKPYHSERTVWRIFM